MHTGGASPAGIVTARASCRVRAIWRAVAPMRASGAARPSSSPWATPTVRM